LQAPYIGLTKSINHFIYYKWRYYSNASC